MRYSLICSVVICLLVCCVVTTAHAQANPRATSQPGPRVAPLADDALITSIAVGSCYRPDRSDTKNVWQTLASLEPDVFLFIGDNMYADLDRFKRAVTVADLHANYALLAKSPYAGFAAQVPVLATWDDHDYGLNDAGAELPFKAESQQALVDFFRDPADAPRRTRPGVYMARTVGPQGRRVQFILLDTRYFRSPMKLDPQARRKTYVGNVDADATVLGDAQWDWLEAQLKRPAEVRVIATSIQAVAREHRFEKWANFPRERQRLFELIKQTGAAGVVLVSGDRHHLELSVEPEAAGYPIYDLTASGMNQGGGRTKDEPNTHRVPDTQAWTLPNVGQIRINWAGPETTLTLRGLAAATGEVVIDHEVKLSDLRSKK